MSSRDLKVTITVTPHRHNQTIRVRAAGKFGKTLLLGKIRTVDYAAPLVTGPDEKGYTVAVLNQAIGLVELL